MTYLQQLQATSYALRHLNGYWCIFWIKGTIISPKLFERNIHKFYPLNSN